MKINQLNKEGLLKLIKAYDEYIIDKCDDEQNVINNCPVCIDEFFDCEFQELLEEDECSDYLVNFNVFCVKTIRANSEEEANDKFINLSVSEVMEDILYEVQQGGLEVGTIEKLDKDSILL